MLLEKLQFFVENVKSLFGFVSLVGLGSCFLPTKNLQFFNLMPYEDVIDEEHKIPSTTKTKIREIVKNHTLTLILKNQESLNLISPLLFLNY